MTTATHFVSLAEAIEFQRAAQNNGQRTTRRLTARLPGGRYPSGHHKIAPGWVVYVHANR